MTKKILSAILPFLIVVTLFSITTTAPNDTKASSYNHLADRPFMGWSSWSSIRKKPTEDKIKAAADIMAAKFKRHGYQYVNLDDYYQLDWTTTVDEYGRWVVDTKKFPHGMKALGDYIHQKGLKFGLYVTLGIPKGAIDQNTPIEGTPYHAKDIVDPSKGKKVSFNFDNMFAIDYSKPGSQEFIDSWAKLFASYGVDYLKIDGVRNEDIPDIEAWAKALQKTGRPIHMELSNNLDIKYVSTWKKLANGWRTDHDVESYGKPTITDWEHVFRRFEDAAKWAEHAEPGGWNDFDSLNVANGSKDGLTEDEKRSYVSLWAIAASHFVIGSDLTNLDMYGFTLLTNDEIIAVNQSGFAGKRLSKTDTSQVFYQKLVDGTYNIALFNTGPSEQTVSVSWTDLGIDDSVMVRDLWEHMDLGSFDSEYTANLRSHASQMIHVIPFSSLIISSSDNELNPISIPASPDWLMVDREDEDTVSITWNPTVEAATYTVYRKEINSLGFSSNYTPIATNLTNPRFADTASKEYGTNYSYKVTATNSLGESDYSVEARTQENNVLAIGISFTLFFAILLIFMINRKRTKQVTA